MPGIAGIIEPALSREAIAARVEALTQAVRVDPHSVQISWFDESFGAGLLVVGRNSTRTEGAVATHADSTLVMEGELFGDANARDRPAEFLLQGYLRHGAEFLAECEGRFVAAVWSGDKRTLTLLTDKFASKPMYYAVSRDSLTFATSIRAIASRPECQGEMNLDGVIQFFTYGHLWNNDTFYSSIRCVGPATELVFDVDACEAAESRYWRPQALESEQDDRDSLRRLTESFKRAVEEQSQGTEGLGVALSGGLDARTMLGLMDPSHSRPVCVSLGMDGSLDQRSAERLARLAGCEYRRIVLGEGFLDAFESHLNRMVDLTDGHYLSQCIVMPTFPVYRELGVRVLLRGHAGELLHMHKAYNFSVDREFFAARDAEALEAWLESRLQSHLTDGVDEPLLRGVAAGEFRESGRRTLRHALANTDHWDRPIDRISQLFLDQRTRRETAMSLVKFNSVVDTRVPYLDSRVVCAAFACSPELRVGETIQTYMLRCFRPDFLRPPNSNTGAPVGAGPAWKQLCNARMRLFAKLGVKGYQPYERLGLWLRREVRPLVEATLLDPRCLDRGLLNPDCVRAVVRRHGRGERNHTYLIMAMMILELGLQRATKGVHESRVASALN